jgi:hypothetical protein
MSIALTITDNGDGTGGVATISGANSALLGLYSMDVYGGYPDGTWDLAGIRTGNGTIAITNGPGNYWFYVDQSSQSLFSIPKFCPITNSSNSTPVVERIANKLLTRLSECTTGNGYAVSVVEAIRPRRNASYEPLNYQVVLSQASDIANDELSRASAIYQHGREVEFNIHGTLMPSDTGTTAFAQLANIFAGELQRAVCTPAATWETFDNLAINARWGEITSNMQTDGNPSGVDLQLTVMYRTDETDPRLART